MIARFCLAFGHPPHFILPGGTTGFFGAPTPFVT
jgi:hypothetical protein